MTEISATVRLRPIRIGFLVRPTDMVAIRKIMQVCACLWGGVYNPIVPVFRNPPKVWRSERFDRVRGLAVAKGYLAFFEPDVFVEASDGLLEEVGLGALRENRGIEPDVVALKDFLVPRDHRDWAEPAFGLSITDAFRDLYESEERFQLRDKRPAVLIKPERNSGLVEAVFGVFPRQESSAYISEAYKDVFHPKELDAGPGSWLSVFKDGARTPLRVTRHKTDSPRSWHHDVVVYVFDPTKPTDLIDLWNLRLEPRPVLPVPVNWFDDLSDHIRGLLKAEYRPVGGNPNGIMHVGTVEFGRSISKNQADDLIRKFDDLPRGSYAVKHWRNAIWIQNADDTVFRDARSEVSSAEQGVRITLGENSELTSGFETLAPEFASRFGGHGSRWVNTLRMAPFNTSSIATVLPFNLFDRHWPRLAGGGDRVTIGSEGWGFAQRFKDSTQSLTLLTGRDAIVGSLDRLGVEATMSEPGHIAKQMLDRLGGLWGVRLLADIDTINLLNRMAGGVRRRANDAETIEETFERRSVPVEDWQKLLDRRKRGHAATWLGLDQFTKNNVIRLGLETTCPHCQARNWHSLTTVDYRLTCERCLNSYDFPQGQLRDRNRNWYYRVIGPFSVVDYGRGAYSALLTLRALDKLGSFFRDEMTFSTAMNLKFDGVEVEVDFVAWRRVRGHENDSSPELVIGETKSLGEGDLIKARDLTKLRAVCRKLPGAVIVISVMRNKFTDSEKKLLQVFINWARRLDECGRPTNPVVLLTAHELLVEYQMSATWKALGKPHSDFTDIWHTRNINNFAEATQAIYLGLPPFHVQRRTKMQQRLARKTKQH